MIDKILAIKKKRRVSEYYLLIFSMFGGCFLALISMYLFKHKIRKKKFIFINIISVIIWIILILK